MARSFWGFGTDYYGKADFNADGSYVTTLWIILFFVPIVPLRSQRIFLVDSSFRYYVVYWSESESFIKLETLPHHHLQIVRVYAYTLGIILSISLVPQGLGTLAQWGIILCVAMVPSLFRFMGRIKRSKTSAFYDAVPDDATFEVLGDRLDQVVDRLGAGETAKDMENWLVSNSSLDEIQVERFVAFSVRIAGLRAQRAEGT